MTYPLPQDLQGNCCATAASGRIYFFGYGIDWFDGTQWGDFGTVPLKGVSGSFSPSKIAEGPDGAIYAYTIYRTYSCQQSVAWCLTGGYVTRYDPIRDLEGTAFATGDESYAGPRMAFDTSGRLWVPIPISNPSGKPFLEIVTNPGTNLQTARRVPLYARTPYVLAAGQDGNIWGFGLTAFGNGGWVYEAYKFDTNGNVVAHYRITKRVYCCAWDVASAPDGSFWLAGTNQVYRIAESGSVTTYTLKVVSPSFGPFDLALG